MGILHLLREVLSTTDAFLVNVLHSPGTVIMLPHVLYEVDARPSWINFWSLLLRGEVFAAELAYECPRWVLFYPVVNKFVGTFGVKLLIAVSTIPGHMGIGFGLVDVLLSSMVSPCLPGLELCWNSFVFAFFTEPCVR